MIKHILLGIGFIIIGLWFVIDTYKNGEELRKSKALGYAYWKGYIAGIGFIVFGILEMFDYWKW